MLIGCKETGQSVLSPGIVPDNNQVESDVYFVMEHQPDSCDQLPADGAITFNNIYVELAHEPIPAPQWQAIQYAARLSAPSAHLRVF
jgi:hypothetical protein